MAIGFLGALGLSSAGAAASSGISSLMNANQASKQRKQNMELAEYSYTKDLEMWNRANAYNDPKAQMERLKNAGLNPNLIYGTGSSTVTGNTSTQLPKYQRPEVPRATIGLELPNMLQSLNMYQDYQNKGVQHDNLTEQTKLMQKESEIKSLSQLKIIAATAKSVTERKRIESLIDGQIKALEYGNIGAKLKNNMLSKDWENYSKYGIRPTDSILWRGGAQLKEKIGNWLNDWKDAIQQAPLKKSWQDLYK